MNASEPDITIMWEYSYEQQCAVPYETKFWQISPDGPLRFHVRRLGKVFAEAYWWPAHQSDYAPSEEACLLDAVRRIRDAIQGRLQEIEHMREELSADEATIRRLESRLEALREAKS